MKAVIYKHIQKKAKFEETEKPEINESEALIKVKYAGICGADLLLIKGERKINSDVIPGHEIVGVVTEIKNGDKYLIGKRVAVEPTISCGNCQMCKLGLPHICYNLKVMGVHTNGGMAEFIKVPLSNLHLIPDEVTDEKASIIEPLAVAVHVVRRSRLELGDSALIVGGGPIGLLIAQVCRITGAEKVKMMEINAYRKDICRQLGFEVLETFKNIVKNERSSDFSGFDISYEVSGSNEGMKEAIKNVRSQGKIIEVGLFKSSFPIEFSEVLFKELEILGSRVYQSKDFKIAIDLLSKNKINTESIITNIINIEDFAQGFNLASDKKAMKVILKVF